jgi:hypothetical protein
MWFVFVIKSQNITDCETKVGWLISRAKWVTETLQDVGFLSRWLPDRFSKQQQNECVYLLRCWPIPTQNQSVDGARNMMERLTEMYEKEFAGTVDGRLEAIRTVDVREFVKK